MRPRYSYLIVIAMAVCALSSACSARSVPAVASAVKAGAQAFKAELAEAEATGQLSADEANLVSPVIDEVISAADQVLGESVNWGAMSKADRAEVTHLAVSRIGDAVEELSNKGIGLKSERARAKFEKYLTDARLAVAGLRVIEASLPQPSPAPAR